MVAEQLGLKHLFHLMLPALVCHSKRLVPVALFLYHVEIVKSQSAFKAYPKMKCVILDFRFTQLPVIQELISTLATDVSFPKLFFGGLGVFSIVLNAICTLNLDRINQ